jgi:predicted transcriptional regulator
MLQGADFRVLTLFAKTDTLSFTKICTLLGYGTDLGGYYLRRLLRGGYMEKTARGQYTITEKGKKLLMLSYDKRPFVLRPRMAILLVASQGDTYATLRRTVQPFIGTTEWPAWSVMLGQSVASAAAASLKARLGLIGQPKLVGFFRRTDIFGDEIFDDKIFAVHHFTIPAGATIQNTTQTGVIEMRDKDQLESVEKPAKSLFDILHFVQSSSSSTFEEHRYELKKDDLADS